MMRLTAKDIQIIIVDPIAELCAELEERFAGIESVSVINNRFENLSEYDCMVSAGNFLINGWWSRFSNY